MQGQVISGRYRIDKTIGRGGMAVVYLAFDLILKRQVAIKILHGHFANNAHFIERFRREAFAAASLVHRNITTIFDTGYANGVYYIVMEYVKGKTLKQIIDERAPLPINEAVDIARQVGEALAHAHERKIIHRDIKPQNILIGADYIVKVTDFGIARALMMPGLTQTGKILGTARYISPEQAKGQQADHRSDMYSLGLILYEMVTGQPPFEGASSVEVAEKHITARPRRPRELNPDVSLALEIIIGKLLKKDPDSRYQEISALLDDFGFWDSPEKQDLLAAGLPTGMEVRRKRPEGRAATKRAKCAEHVKNTSSGFEEAGTKTKRRAERSGRAQKRKLTASAKALVVLCLIAAFGFGVYSLFSGAGDTEAVDKSRTHAKPQKVKVAGEQIGSLKPMEIVDYNPNGDGDENPDQVNNAIDGNPKTYWSTRTYRSATFKGQNGGVGIYLDYEQAVALEELTISSSGGWDGAIKASDDALNWVAIKEIKGATQKMTIKIGSTAHKYYLIWFTRLPGTHGAHSVKLYEVVGCGRML